MLLIEVKRGGATMHARPERRAPDGSAEENNLLSGVGIAVGDVMT